MPSQVLFLLKRTPTMQSHAAQKGKLQSEKWTTCWVGNWEWFWGNHFCNIWIFNWKMSGNWSPMKRGMMRKWCAYLGGWNRMVRTTRKYSFRNHVTSSPTTRKKRNFLWTISICDEMIHPIMKLQCINWWWMHCNYMLHPRHSNEKSSVTPEWWSPLQYNQKWRVSNTWVRKIGNCCWQFGAMMNLKLHGYTGNITIWLYPWCRISSINSITRGLLPSSDSMLVQVKPKSSCHFCRVMPRSNPSWLHVGLDNKCFLLTGDSISVQSIYGLFTYMNGWFLCFKCR